MQRECTQCGTPFQAQRSSAKYCSGNCRARASQGHKPVKVAFNRPSDEPEKRQIPLDSLAETTRKRLEAVGRHETVAGVQALTLARLIEASGTTPAAIASLSKEFRAVMDVALEGVSVAGDPMDELEARRRAKLAG